MKPWRLLTLVCVTFALLSLLIAQFFHLQVNQGTKWSRLARKQHFLLLREPASRGRFFVETDPRAPGEKKRTMITYDLERYHLYADPLAIPEQFRLEITQDLSKALHLSSEKKRWLSDQLHKRSRSRKLAMWLERETHDAIQNWWKQFRKGKKIPSNALFFVTDYQRSYPYNAMLGQVIHTIQHQKDEGALEALPTGGLEFSLNQHLRGKSGKRLLLRSPRNALETGWILDSPEQGSDVILTIDPIIQSIAEREVERGVIKAKAKGGWAVVMNPHNGEILALAQYPFFYPSRYTVYFNDGARIDHTRVKAITDAQEPGSIMKPLTLAIALQANEAVGNNIFDPEEKIACADGNFPGRTTPIKDTTVHRFLNMDLALQKSSNVYMGKLAERIISHKGSEWYRNQLKEVFGFGEKTTIELPGESRGVLPRIGKTHPNGTLEWSKATPYSLAFGYNLQATSLQLLRAWAVLANGGYRVEPTLIRQINNSASLPLPHKERVLSQATVTRVREALQLTTKEGGTARRGALAGYTEGCKTGTARKIVGGKYTSKKHIASYMGFAPLDNPALLILVMIDEPEVRYIPGEGNHSHGSICAAPIFKKIGTQSLSYLGIPYDDPFGFPAKDPRFDPEKAKGEVRNRYLKKLYDRWKEQGD